MSESEMPSENHAKSRVRINRWAIVVTLIAITGIGPVLLLNSILSSSARSTASSPPVVSKPVVDAVTALGRLEPHGEVIRVSAPSFTEGSRVIDLLVQETDIVKKGQVIAILDRRDRLQATLKQAQQNVAIARARLAQVQAGAKQGDIAAQQAQIERLQVELADATAAQRANVARLQAELANAQLEYQRYQRLYEEGAVSVSVRDSKQLAMDTVQQQLNEAQKELSRTIGTLQKQIQEARNTLDSVAEVRPTDVRAAEAELRGAIAAEQKARADLYTAYVRAPQAGEILRIHTRAGETVGSDGIVDLGQTQQMDVIAEVYENDLSKVKIGQRATITSANKAFSGELEGVVYRIIPLIGKQDVLNTDPAAAVDARVAEVKIRLDAADSQRMARLTNLSVEVAIAHK